MVGGSLRVLQFFHHSIWSPWYNWNIAESVAKHQKSQIVFERAWWRLFQKSVVRTKFDIYVFSDDCFVSVNNIPIYSGTRSVTVAGQTCQRWDTTSPHKPVFPMSSDHSNYCRSPDEDFTLWCYTMDPDVVWNTCDVPRCVPGKSSQYYDSITWWFSYWPNYRSEDCCIGRGAAEGQYNRPRTYN